MQRARMIFISPVRRTETLGVRPFQRGHLNTVSRVTHVEFRAANVNQRLASIVTTNAELVPPDTEPKMKYINGY